MMYKKLLTIFSITLFLSLTLVMAQASSCNSCGAGLFNLCDRTECHSLGETCYSDRYILSTSCNDGSTLTNGADDFCRYLNQKNLDSSISISPTTTTSTSPTTAPDIEWESVFTPSQDRRARSVKQTSDGGYIATGEEIGNTGGSTGRIYLTKTDSSGNILWDKPFGNTGISHGYDTQQTSDGGYVLTGWTSTNGVFNHNAYIVKTDSSGNMEWDKEIGGTGEERVYTIEETSDGSFIIAGSINPIGLSGGKYLVKVDSSGNVVFEKTLGQSGESLYSASETSDNGYILAGFKSIGGSNSDAQLIKTDSSGNVLWERTYGGPKSDVAVSVQQTTDDGYIFTGRSESSTPGDWDYYLVRTDSAGNVVWEKRFGGTKKDHGESVDQTSDGGYVLTGLSASFSGTNVIYIVKTDALGNLEWEKIIDDSGLDLSYSIQQTSDNGYILAGETKPSKFNAKIIKLKGTSTPPTISSNPGCRYEEGDCDSNNECQSGLECSGSLFGDDACCNPGEYFDGTSCTTTNPLPTTNTTNTTTSGSIICSTNADCGTDNFIGNSSCIGNDLHQDKEIFTCTNPGTTSSACSSTIASTLKTSCGASGCSAGACNSCIPKTCTDLNTTCNSVDDSCGTTIFCGSCQSGEICSSGSCIPTPPITPTTTPTSCNLRNIDIPHKADGIYPGISNNKVYWSGSTDTFEYDLSTDTNTQVTGGDITQGPAGFVQDDKVVWTDRRFGNNHVYVYDTNTGSETQITSSPGDYTYPSVFGDNVVYLGEKNGDTSNLSAWDVYVYDMSTSTETRVTTNSIPEFNTYVSRNNLVYLQDKGGNRRLIHYDISTGAVKEVLTNAAISGQPIVDGNTIVWQENRNNQFDIFMYDLTTDQETQLTNDPNSNGAPFIDGNYIVWTNFNSANEYELYLYDISASSGQVISTASQNSPRYPTIYGNQVLWSTGGVASDDVTSFPFQLHLYDIC